MKMYYKIVELEWIDSGFSLLGNVWQTREDIYDVLQQPKTVKTIGYLFRETKDWVVLVQSINDDVIRGGYLVYKKNIINRKELNDL